MIVALMSTYREGPLALSAARSALAAADALFVLEAAIGEAAPGGDPTPLDEIGRLGTDTIPVLVDESPEIYASDADKRNDLLGWAREACGGEEVWCFWLDGDEVLVWGEYLPDHVYRAQAQNNAGGFFLRIVELDGSVALGHCRVFRLDSVHELVEGAYQVRLAANGIVVSLPNEMVCAAGGVPVQNPDGSPVVLDDLMKKRPPVDGEPHILHRSILRHPGRSARRIHGDETGFYERSTS